MSQLGIRTESVGAGDQSWLASMDGATKPKSVTLSPAAWSAKITADNRIKSGEPYAEVSGLVVPYNSGGTGGTNVLAGFIKSDQSVRSDGGNVTCEGIWRGRILSSKLPSTVAVGVNGLFKIEA